MKGEKGWWILQRLSGLLLILPLTIHLLAQATGKVSLEFQFANDLMLLVLIVLHGIPGLRTTAYDYIRNARARVWIDRLLWLIGVTIVGYGAWGLWVFPNR